MLNFDLNNKKNLLGVVLAAGNSSRLGRPKQLVKYRERTLLTEAVYKMQSVGLNKIVVVLGAFEQECRKALQDSSTIILHNEHWQNGMGTTIKCALEYVGNCKLNVDGVLLTVCDQPLIPLDHFTKMITYWQQHEVEVVATKYSHQNGGIPALFSATQFESLKSIDEFKGAKNLIAQIEQKHLIPCEDAQFDVDSLEDILTLRQYERNNIKPEFLNLR